MIISIAYHYIRPCFKQPYPGVFGLTPEEFAGQLKILSQYGEFISQERLQNALYNNEELPEKGWLISFDDGLREQYEYALPILDEMAIPAMFFVNTSPLADKKILYVHMTHLLRSNVAPAELVAHIYSIADKNDITITEVDSLKAVKQYCYDNTEVAELKYLLNFSLSQKDRDFIIEKCFASLLSWDNEEVSNSLYMSKAQMKELASRGYLGAHTHSHRPLATLNKETVQEEITKCVSYIESWTGKTVDTLGYPYGSKIACSVEVAQIASDLGVNMAFTMERAGIDDKTNPLLIPRCAPNDLPGGNKPIWKVEDLFQEVPSSSWYQT